MNNINFIEWDAKHKQYLIRLAGDADSQEERLAKMKVAEEMYEALRIGFKLADAIIRDIEKQKGKTPSVEVLMARATMSEAIAKAESK